MPKGQYTHGKTEAQRESAKRNLAKGREAKARQKAQATLQKLAKSETWRSRVGDGTKAAMARPEVRAKLRTRAKRQKPMVGCNGAPMTEVMSSLANLLLPQGWKLEFSIPTRGATGDRLPPCYKADFALPDLKLVLEIDGPYHNLRRVQAQDRKKEAALASLGWTVCRMSNECALKCAKESPEVFHPDCLCFLFR